MEALRKSCPSFRRSWSLSSLVGGFCTCLLGCLWPLKAMVPQVVLAAGPPAPWVMVCEEPDLKGLVEPSLGRTFLATAQWDLSHSGPVRPLLAKDLPSSGQASHLAMRQAGATLLLRTELKRGWRGKLLVSVEVTDLGSEARVFGKAYAGEDRAVPRLAHRMVDDLLGALTGLPGVANSRLVFAHREGPHKELYQVDLDGKNLVRLTHHESLTLSPSVTSSGKLCYVSYVGGLPNLWGQLKQRGAFKCLFPPEPSETEMAFTPAWSPDGKRMAFVRPNHRGDSDLWLLAPENGKLRQLTGRTGINTEPAWSPNGTQLAFTSDRGGTPQIYLMERDGSNVRPLTLEGAYNASPAWSPDGSMLAYVSRMDGRFNLFVYKLLEGKAYQITRGVGSSESPAWSPDGRWLAFASDQDDKRQLYVVDLSGTTLRKVLELTNCQSPQWTRSR